MSWKLLKGDCNEILPTLELDSVNAIITDPPYGVGEYFTNYGVVDTSNRVKGKGFFRAAMEWDDAVPTKWLVLALPLLKEGGSVLWFSSWKHIDAVLKTMNDSGLSRKDIVVWDKINPMPRIKCRGYRYSHEFIVWATKGDGHYWGGRAVTKDILRCTLKDSTLLKNLCLSCVSW